MRFGPFEIRAAAPTIPAGETGITGTTVSRGTATSAKTAPDGWSVTEQDYLPELQGDLLYLEYDKMRRSDSTVHAAVSAIKLPLLGVEYRVEAVSEDEQDKLIAEWVADVLFERLSTTWLAVMRHALLSLDYGSSVHEIVWRVVDDPMLGRPAAVVHKLAPRLPRSIAEYQVDRNGGLEGIVQRGSEMNDFTDTAIPVKEGGVQKLLVYVNDQEGANFWGVSMMRAARRDWFYKSKFYALLGIIYEKRGAGIDVGRLLNQTASKLAAARRVLMGVRTNPRAYVLESKDFEYRVEGTGTGGVVIPLDGMKYADVQIVRGMLVEHLTMGDGEGARAVHSDKTLTHFQNMATILGETIAVMNRHLVPDMVRLNFPNVTKFPKIAHGRLDRRDLAVMVEALKSLIPLDAIKLYPDLVREIHSMLELPTPPDDLLEEEDEEPEAPPSPDAFADVPGPDEGDLDNSDIGDVDPELAAVWAGSRVIQADRRGDERRLRRVWEKRLKAEGRAAAQVLARGGPVADVNLNLIGRYGTATAQELGQVHLGVLRGPGLDVLDKRIIDRNFLSQRYGTTRSRRILNGMEGSTRRSLEAALRRLPVDANPQQIRAAVRESYAFSPNRAKVIARNEVDTARSDAKQIAETARGKTQKGWFNQGDDRVDANGPPSPCIENQAQGWIPIAAKFESGDTTIPAHNRCRCRIEYR